MDFVGRMENIDDDFRYICQRLGVAAELKVTNRSNHPPYSEYYADGLRERVAAVYAHDIAIFDYQFNQRPARSLVSQHPGGGATRCDKSGASPRGYG
jgi:hypothetical protein